MGCWLIDKLLKRKDQPNPFFAFQSTINWMRALGQIVSSDKFSNKTIIEVYSNVQRRQINEEADTLVYENLLMAIHNLSALQAINKEITNKVDTCRIAIISWYYVNYFTASAMNAAASGSSQETHALTAKVWHSDIVLKSLIPYPFNLHLTSLKKEIMDEELAIYRGDNKYDLSIYSDENTKSHGVIVSYLSGTAEYKKWESEEIVKNKKEFKELKVDNFRTKAARNLRDEQYSKGHINYLDQAFRYRGKANYRDSIYLSYGKDVDDKVVQFTNDLENVAKAFLKAGIYYVIKRVKKDTWDLFVNDIKEKSKISVSLEDMKIE